MAKTRLTDSYIRERVRPTKGSVIDFDTDTKGLAVRFTPTGTPTFLFCYGGTLPGSNQRRMAIGQWSPAHGKQTASMIPRMRARVDALVMEVKSGRDPYVERALLAQERAAELAAAQAARSAEAAELSVDQLCDKFLDEHFDDLRPDNKRRTERRMARHVRPTLGTLKAKNVTQADLVKVLATLRKAGKRAELNHVLALFLAMFKFAVRATDIPSVNINPAAKIKEDWMKRSDKPQAKDRALTTAREFRAFWLVTSQGTGRESERMHPDAADCLRFMMLTGCRPTEAGGLRWEEIDFFAKLWTKPDGEDGRSKSKRADVVPLVDAAMAILLPRRGNGSEFVFPSGRSRRDANGGGDGALTENRLAAALRRVGPRLARMGIRPFTPHDLRRTVTTGLFELGIPEYTVKRTLNHATSGVTDTHYNMSTFVRYRRRALMQWAAYLEQTIRTGKTLDQLEQEAATAMPSNVVPLFAGLGARP